MLACSWLFDISRGLL